MMPPRREFRDGLVSALISMMTSSSTLICCALPALLVAIGAGSTLASLVGALPMLVVWSANKVLVFGGAGLMLLVAGGAQYRARLAPCATDATLARVCQRTRRTSRWLYAISVATYCVGVTFAFVLPQMRVH